MIVRVVAGLLVLLLGAAVVRNGAVAAFAERAPQSAARAWADHPASQLSVAMTAIATATREGRPVDQATLAMVDAAAGKAPLSPEPYLVRGVEAQLAGDSARAALAFEAAQWRDPRSLPAAYFLAEHYFRAGEAGPGLRQVAALSRLAPQGLQAVAPYLATYARDRSNWPALRELLRRNPDLAQSALVTLARDPSGVDAVLALAGPGRPRPNTPWVGELLATLVKDGQYARAKAIWARSAGAQPRSGQWIHDAGFADKQAPPPFNWALTSSPVGIAERQPGGRLHALFYGQQDGVLASQLVLLEPGSYFLSLQLLGGHNQAEALSWSIRCDKAAAPAARITLDEAARGWRFTVPAGCPAQWLELAGRSSDMPQQADVTIAGLKLQRVASGG
jgi:hypothetical protein